MDGTHRPTNTPASLLALTPIPNQSTIENRNDRNAAERMHQSAFVNTSFTSDARDVDDRRLPAVLISRVNESHVRLRAPAMLDHEQYGCENV